MTALLTFAAAFLGSAAVIVAVVLVSCQCEEAAEIERSGHRGQLRWDTRLALGGRAAARRIVGQRGIQAAADLIHWLFERPNPVFQIVYGLLVLGSYSLFVLHCWQYLPDSHKPFTAVTVLVCFLSFFKVSAANPGNICQTCKFEKPARSKHCRVCGYCVGRFDHHCIWVNNCIGAGNYHYFIAFLTLHVILCSYGFALLVTILLRIVVKEKLLSSTFVDSQGRKYQATMSIVFSYLFQNYYVIVWLMVLAIVVGIFLSFFLFWHLWLIAGNQTTNENAKASYLQSLLEAHRNSSAKEEKSQSAEQDKSPTRKLRIDNSRIVTESQIQHCSTFYDQGMLQNFLEVFRFRLHRSAAKCTKTN